MAYLYNPLGELLEVTHPNGRKTAYAYDALGRKLSVDHPDAGRTSLSYDPAGNLLTRQTPNLAKLTSGGHITYVYDHERLAEVQYPKNIFNRVQYTYGAPGEAHNRAGRLVLVQDASGGAEYFYGKMGEVTKTVRTLMLNSSDVRTYVSAARYDSWNRIREMDYPDGERVAYAYDAAGQLRSVTAVRDTAVTRLVTAMEYDVYGNVAGRTYGNGAVSRYTYDPLRQRLASMTASSAAAGTFLDARYSYDRIGNVLGITNAATPSGSLGGSYSHSYAYDGLSRLTSASGTCRDSVSYSLRMEYDVMGNPLRKTLDVSGSTVASSHDLHYLYGGMKPDAVSEVSDGAGSGRYTYDENGNPTVIETDSTYRQMQWDEENRLLSVDDDGYVSRYTYDHAGRRAIRSHGPVEAVYVDGAPQGITYHDEESYTLYVSPYLTVTDGRFTKHYYAGAQRIATKLGTGSFDNIYGVNNFHLTAGQKDYAERMVQMETGRQAYYKEQGVPPGVPTQKGQTGEPEILGAALPNVPLGNYDVPDGWPTPPHFNAPGDVPGPPVMWEEPEDITDPAPGYGYVADTTAERDLYFFHTDHMGSTAYLTDRDGKISQFVYYIPYGEALVDEHATTYENPFKFSGKELDDITGLYDHGARSRDPKVTMWYGVDPLYERYPDMSPYVYCAGNPVKFIDPDGMDYYSSTDENGNEVIQWQDSEKAFYIDEDGNSWEYYSAGQKEEVVITPTQEQKQDIKEKRAEEQDRNIKKYWHDKAENSDSWEAKFGYWLKSKGGYDVDEKFSEAARPIAQGAALLNPLVGIPNDIKTIFTGEDIYGNEATSVDKGIAVLDMVTLGLSSKLMNVPVSIAKRSDIANKGTTIYSVFVTTYNGIKEKRNE